MADLEFLFADKPFLDVNDSDDHIGNEADRPAVPEDGTDVYEPIHRSNLQHLRDKLLPRDLVKKVRAVLDMMQEEHVNMTIFLENLLRSLARVAADWYPRDLNTSLRAFCKILAALRVFRR
ncbi:hypothetical protein C8R44DRAFT_745384 [Mycena epipterygia]|nr:hypothetical protein C8R44DRAFT_745384 [Mycena epipterygia]